MELNAPPAHATHILSTVLEPAAPTNWPALQVVHGVHAAAFIVALKLVAPQALQVRSAVAVPAPPTN